MANAPAPCGLSAGGSGCTCRLARPVLIEIQSVPVSRKTAETSRPVFPSSPARVIERVIECSARNGVLCTSDRGQYEKEAKHAKLFQRVDPNFLEWEEAQRARVKAEAAYRAARGQKRLQLLKEWLILSFLTVMPPDRVGVIRKLRWNASLKRAGNGFVLDCSTQRSHKTSKL